MFFSFPGSYRECFSRSYKLGIRSRPIKLTPTCELQRTQRDPSSSIRACLCTTSNCNILDSEQAQFRNTSSNAKTKVVGKIFCYIAFQSVFFLSLHRTSWHAAYQIDVIFRPRTFYTWISWISFQLQSTFDSNLLTSDTNTN